MTKAFVVKTADNADFVDDWHVGGPGPEQDEHPRRWHRCCSTGTLRLIGRQVPAAREHQVEEAGTTLAAPYKLVTPLRQLVEPVWRKHLAKEV